MYNVDYIRQKGYIEGHHLYSCKITPEQLLLGVIFNQYDMHYVEKCLTSGARNVEREIAHKEYTQKHLRKS